MARIKKNGRKSMWFYLGVGAVVLIFLAWLGVSVYLRTILPGRLFETDKSRSKIHLKHTTDFVKNKKGEKIEIVTFPGKNSKEIILYLHGSVGRLANVVTGAREAGIVVSPAFPGYAKSEGKPTTQNIYETVDVTMKYLHESGYKDENIVVLGHSMGGSAGIYAAILYPNLKKVVLVNTFYSIQKICNMDHKGFCLLTSDVLNSGLLAPHTKAKIRQFHDEGDKVVPFTHGQSLFEKLGSRDKKFFIHGGTHRFFNVKNALTKE